MIPSSWTTERDQILREKWSDHSASFLSDMLGTTRNAIIGRARRLGLFKDPAASKIVKLRPTNPITVRRLPKVQPIFQAEKQVEVEFTSLNISIDELDASFRKCRWPIDGDPITYCGNQNEKDRSFCPHHCAMAYDKRTK